MGLNKRTIYRCGQRKSRYLLPAQTVKKAQ